MGRRFAHCFLALMHERPAIMLAYRWSIQSMSWAVEGGLCDELCAQTIVKDAPSFR